MSSAIPTFYLRGSSEVADYIFQILNVRWMHRYRATGEEIDIAVNGPPEIWRALSAEYPEMPHQIRREILSEVMAIIDDHVGLIMREVEGHA